MPEKPSDRIETLLHEIYPAQDSAPIQSRITELIEKHPVPASSVGDYFSERNITLITYGDTLQQRGESPLHTFHHFLQRRLKGLLSTIHILPFYPYSSDDGFSVVDYYTVNPMLGDWADIQKMGKDFRLMFDGVINHMSAESEWFKGFLADNPAFKRLFITEDPTADLRRVTRPRTSPLLTPFTKSDGKVVHVWTTFSADQVDFDYRSPDTLLRILDVLLFYVEQGAEVLRLDAIAYLWKEIGTSCIHLPQTHAVVQLIRAVLDEVAPHVVLITETNVPHIENISYFGVGSTSEAQLVYNFTLPPLLFYSLTVGDSQVLSDWVNSLYLPAKKVTWFNFTASHDGIGVRPLEGILNAEQLDILIRKVENSGGTVSYKANSDGTRSPYELNITYLDAVTDAQESTEFQVRRFLVSQAIMLALAGVPAIYIHSLLGSHNDLDGMRQAGYPRAINRQKLDVTTTDQALDSSTSFRSQVFQGYTHLIKTRIQSPAFHPQAGQQASVFNNGAVFCLKRTLLDNSHQVLCLFNMTHDTQEVRTDLSACKDLLTGESLDGNIELTPYQVRWLQHETATENKYSQE